MSYFYEASRLIDEVSKRGMVYLEYGITVPKSFDSHEERAEDWLFVNYMKFHEGKLFVGTLGGEMLPVYELSPSSVRLLRAEIS